MGRGMPGIGRTAAKLQSARFDLSQEYKAKGLAAGKSGGGSGMPTNYEKSSMDGMDSGEGTAVDDLNSDENRYITVEDAYRTRGFHIVVKIHQQYVPDLVRELLNSQYPIDIMRIEQAALNPDDPNGDTTGSGVGPGSIASGQPGFNGATGASGFEKSEGSENFDTEETGSDGQDAFDQSTSAGATAAPVTDAAVIVALQELDLVELAIVGEMYLYNPPPVTEDAEAPAEGDAVEGDAESPATQTPAETLTQRTDETPTAAVPDGTPVAVPAGTGEITQPAPAGTPAAVPQNPQPETGTPAAADPSGTGDGQATESPETTPESAGTTQKSSETKQPEVPDSGG
jgi:hypothetical protein